MTESIPPCKLGLSRRREIDVETVGAKLYAADRRLLDDEVGKKETTRSELIRQIVRQCAIKKRLAPDANRQRPGSNACRPAKAVTKFGEARKEIKTLLAQLKEAAAMQAIRSL